MSSVKRSDSHRQSQLSEKLPIILKICQKMNAERDLPALLNLIALEATRLVEAEQSSIFLLDREKQELWSIVTLDGSQIRFDARLGIAGAAAMTSQTINVEDAYQDPRFYKRIDGQTGYRTRSLLVVPLKPRQGEVIGTFQVLNNKNGAFNKDHEEILEALAVHAATAIETAQLFGQLKRRQEQLLRENTQLWKDAEGRFSTQNILGTSPQIQNVVRLIEEISDSFVNVLITGESGTGKELVARAIHYNSSRARSPFVALNCAALPETLVESELFGIERGVATGVEKRIGKFEAANGGTLLLDEIGDLSLAAQAKILRVLQEGVIERVGGRGEIPVYARILAATNKNLEAEIKNGSFRKDLYYRLKVAHIHLPSLHEIPEDIQLLANYFLGKYCREMNKEPKKLSPAALERLTNYTWPGNVRELESEMKRLIVLTPRKIITEDALSESIQERARREIPLGFSRDCSLKAAVEELEKTMILEALQTSHNNQARAARALELSRCGLIKKIKRYGIRLT
jgi:Nif-specific regulatory protein